MVLLILFSVILTAAGLIFQKPLLLLLGASEVTLPYAQQYISIYLLGTVFVLLSLGLNNFINAQGFAKIGMCTVAIGAGLNIVLDPIFIFTFGLGVRGAAIATVISQFAGAMWTIRFLTGKRALIRIQKKYFRLKAARVKKMLALGLSGFTMAVTNSTVQMVCNATLQTHGGDIYVGIMTIINSVREIVTLPVTGFTNAGQPVLGYNYGAGEYGRIKKTIRDMTVVVFLYTVGAWILISAVPQIFIRLFGGTGEVLTLGAHSMHLYFFGFCFMAFQFCGQTVFTGLGKPKRGDLLFDFPEGDHCGAADTFAAPAVWYRGGRRVPGGADLQRDRRAGLLYHHDGDGCIRDWGKRRCRRLSHTHHIFSDARISGKAAGGDRRITTMKITILNENVTYKRGLLCEHGLSC